jgi:hypothetical protein
MGAGFVVGMAGGLQLKGGVLDVEMVRKAVLQPVEEHSGIAVS